jgi:hypothetical protein
MYIELWDSGLFGVQLRQDSGLFGVQLRQDSGLFGVFLYCFKLSLHFKL